MASRFRFVVEAEFERDEGKFEARDGMAEEVSQALEGADPGSFTGDNGGTYSVTSWSVSEEDPDLVSVSAKELARLRRIEAAYASHMETHG